MGAVIVRHTAPKLKLRMGNFYVLDRNFWEHPRNGVRVNCMRLTCKATVNPSTDLFWKNIIQITVFLRSFSWHCCALALTVHIRVAPSFFPRRSFISSFSVTACHLNIFSPLGCAFLTVNSWFRVIVPAPLASALAAHISNLFTCVKFHVTSRRCNGAKIKKGCNKKEFIYCTTVGRQMNESEACTQVFKRFFSKISLQNF